MLQLIVGGTTKARNQRRQKKENAKSGREERPGKRGSFLGMAQAQPSVQSASYPLKHLCAVAGWLQSSYQYRAGALLRRNQLRFVHLPLLRSTAAVIQLEESQRARTSPPSPEPTAKPWPRDPSAHFPSVPANVPTNNSRIPYSTQTFTQSFPYLMPSLKISG